MKFKEGDRVRMSPRALKAKLHIPGSLPIESSSTGVIISILPNGHIRVLRDKRKDIQRYHPDFWIKEEA